MIEEKYIKRLSVKQRKNYEEQGYTFGLYTDKHLGYWQERVYVSKTLSFSPNTDDVLRWEQHAEWQPIPEKKPRKMNFFEISQYLYKEKSLLCFCPHGDVEIGVSMDSNEIKHSYEKHGTINKNNIFFPLPYIDDDGKYYGTFPTIQLKELENE